MVKLRKVSVEGRNYLGVFGYSKCKGYRKKRAKALKKMLTPGRSGPISSEELGDGDPKDSSASANGGARSQAFRIEGNYENDGRAKEFLSTGRAGRRNALTEFLGRHAETAGVIDLPDRFEELSVGTGGQSNNGGQDGSSPGTSKQQG